MGSLVVLPQIVPEHDDPISSDDVVGLVETPVAVGLVETAVVVASEDEAVADNVVDSTPVLQTTFAAQSHVLI